MKIKFSLSYFIVFICLLAVEIFIGVYVRDSFIRPFVGDVLSVCTLFSMLRIFIRGNGLLLVLAVLLFAVVIEFAQYFNLVDCLKLEKGSISYIMLGATFDPLDLLAYSIGSICNFYFDRKYFSFGNE